MLAKVSRSYSYKKLLRPPSTNYNLANLAHNPYEMLPQGALILDVGCKSSGGGYAFSDANNNTSKHVLFGLDVKPFRGVDVVGNAHDLPFRPESLNCVFCVSLLEHAADPRKVVGEIFRVLKPGSLVYLNVPFVFRYAPDQEDLYRFSIPALEVLCASFKKVQSGYNRGPASTMCDLLVHFNAILFCFNNRRIHNVLVDIFQWGFFWLKYLDRWIGDYEMAHVIYSGAFFLGQKPLTQPIIRE